MSRETEGMDWLLFWNIGLLIILMVSRIQDLGRKCSLEAFSPLSGAGLSLGIYSIFKSLPAKRGPCK